MIAEGATLKPQKAYLSEGYDWLSRMLARAPPHCHTMSARAPPAHLMLQRKNELLNVTFNNSLSSPRSVDPLG